MRIFFVGPQSVSERHTALQSKMELGQSWSTPQWSEADGWWTKAGWYSTAMVLLISGIVFYQAVKPPQKTEGRVEYTYTEDGEDTKVYLNTQKGVVEMHMPSEWRNHIRRGDWVHVAQRDGVIVETPKVKTPLRR